MAKFNGKWVAIDSTNVEGYLAAAYASAELKNQLTKLYDDLENDPKAYIEEMTVTASGVRRVIYLYGQMSNDTGELKFNVEQATKTTDGLPTKVRVIRDSDTKIVSYESCNDYVSMTETETVGNQLLMTMVENGQKMTITFNKV
jgi:hypothetical protein